VCFRVGTRRRRGCSIRINRWLDARLPTLHCSVFKSVNRLFRWELHASIGMTPGFFWGGQAKAFGHSTLMPRVVYYASLKIILETEKMQQSAVLVKRAYLFTFRRTSFFLFLYAVKYVFEFSDSAFVIFLNWWAERNLHDAYSLSC